MQERAHSRRPMLLLAAGAALLTASCNAAIGGGVVALLGGAGYFASQCYDRVRVRVRDPHTGQATCSADVFVTDSDGSQRRLRPCYSAALTPGKWRLTAHAAGYATASTDIEIAEREGACPHYTRSVELTLRREGEPATASVARSLRDEAPPAAPTSPTSDLESPPARIVPPPIPSDAARPIEAPASPAPAPPAAEPPAPAPPAPAPAAPAPAPAPAPPTAPPPAGSPR